MLANLAFVAFGEREADFGETGFEDASELSDAVIVVHGLELWHKPRPRGAASLARARRVNGLALERYSG